MLTIKDMIRQANADGYVDDNAEAKVCQDVVLKAIFVILFNNRERRISKCENCMLYCLFWHL